MKKPTFHEGQRVLIRKRKPRYQQDHPDIIGTIARHPEQKAAIWYQGNSNRGLMGWRVSVRQDGAKDFPWVEAFADDVHPLVVVSSILRTTPGYIVTQAKRGVRISAKDPKATPKSRVVSLDTWSTLREMNDSAFDGTAVLELGIGTFARRPR